MRYEIRMHGYNEDGKYTLYPPLFETDDLSKAFTYLERIKTHEEDELYYNYEEATLFDGAHWIVNMKLH